MSQTKRFPKIDLICRTRFLLLFGENTILLLRKVYPEGRSEPSPKVARLDLGKLAPMS
jgi:hypothetical protein